MDKKTVVSKFLIDIEGLFFIHRKGIKVRHLSHMSGLKRSGLLLTLTAKLYDIVRV